MAHSINPRVSIDVEFGIDRVRFALHALGYLIATGDHASLQRDQLGALVGCVEGEANRLHAILFPPRG